MDTRALKESWQLVARSGDQVPLFFYSALFLMHPELRDMFPVSMAAQRGRLINALGHIVSNVDRVDELVPYLQQLGRDHRKYSVITEHYPAVGQALLATLQHFLGDRWTPALAHEWSQAYNLIAKVMTEAAEESASTTPPWWEGEVILHEERAPGIAVIRARLNLPYPFRPGQSASIASPLRPKVWRYYSFANAPRRDNTIDLHVRVVDGGVVSTALVHNTQCGDILRVAAPVGDRLTLDPRGSRDLILIAGGTGLAPLKALVEQVAYEGPSCNVHLFVGARTSWELYDLESLSKMDVDYPWLTVVPVVSHDRMYRGEQGYVVDAAVKVWRGQDVYVCGSEEMVRGTVTRLLDAGVPEEQIRFDEFTSDGGRVQ
ncbi:globin domain-containing protein [Thermostaphylospora chromogena]|uniref:nitric oxide dioxygenase n=1 Tax=Thermostaphylospora chromogena TaxID=35622 RepID=A0A1H1BYF1_9ACTN|nr:globin domain-containing protein [Thermostaphylospora chromogena]SDQ56965.1 NAD(P)H-flavin reductase [Thermostaphylospora chromogena]